MNKGFRKLFFAAHDLLVALVLSKSRLGYGSTRSPISMISPTEHAPSLETFHISLSPASGKRGREDLPSSTPTAWDCGKNRRSNAWAQTQRQLSHRGRRGFLHVW